MVKKLLGTLVGLVVAVFATMLVATVIWTPEAEHNLIKAFSIDIVIFTHCFFGIMLLPTILTVAAFIARVWLGLGFKYSIFFVAAVILLLKVVGLYDFIAALDITGIGTTVVLLVGIVYSSFVFVFN